MLAREGASATFFVIPEHVTAETAPIVWRAVDEGHGVALHSGTRALMLKAPAAWRRCSRRRPIESKRWAAPGRAGCSDRTPAGAAARCTQGLDRAGYRLAGWGFAMWDFNWWRAPQPARLAARLAKRASDGSIVVMHDGHHKNPRSDRLRTATATAELIPLLKRRGFVFRSLCPAPPSHETGEPTVIAPLAITSPNAPPPQRGESAACSPGKASSIW